MLATEGTASSPSNGGKDLFVIVTGLQKEITVEQIRSCYENVGVVLRMKVYSTDTLGNVAILELDSTETLMRASCRRVQMGDYISQAIYAYREPMPEISLLIRKKTKLKLQYELKNKQDPQKYKDSLLQFLCKNAGFFNVKKCRCIDNKGDITLSVESGFSLSKISGSSLFVFDGVVVNFSYVIDKIDENSLRTVVIPSHLTMSGKEPRTGSNLNFAINTLRQNMQSRLVQDPILSEPTDNTILSIASWAPATPSEDKLETIQASADSSNTRYLHVKNSQQVHSTHRYPMFFSLEQNLAFMQMYLPKYRTSNYFTANIHNNHNQTPRLTSGTTPLVPEQSEERPIPYSQSVQPSLLSVPIELKVVEILYKLVNLSATSTATTVAAVSQEVYTSIATKIDPSTPVHQMLRVTLKILKTKFRKVKRRERKREGHAGRDADEQDESAEEDPLLSGPKVDGHPLVYQVVTKLAKSGENGYIFSSDELWKVLQSCDPEWRNFIWKYRTAKENPQKLHAYPKSQLRECSDEKTNPRIQQHLTEQACEPILAGQQSKEFPACEQSKNKGVDNKLQFYFRDQNIQEKSEQGGASRKSNQGSKIVPLKEQLNTYCPFRPGYILPKPLLLEPGLLRHRLKSLALDSQTSAEGKCRTTPNQTDNERSPVDPAAGSPTPHATSSLAGDDFWSLQHIESNLRFNRMVSPILWR
jgi:hypothetical protein